MSIQESDELIHQFGKEPLWRESLFFNWHDASGKIAGTTTIGIRPNQHRYEGLSILFIDKQALFFHTQGPLEHAGNLYSVPGLTCTIEKPLQQWRVEVKARFFEMEGQGTLSREAVPIDCRLSFDAVNPVYPFPKRGLAEMGIAKGHYEQCGRFRGSVAVEEKVYQVDGLGFRDHSWGVRDLQKAGNLVSLFAQFADDFTVNAAWGKAGGREMAIGYVWRDGRNHPVTGMRVSVEMDPRGLPDIAEAQITANGLGCVGIRANVKAVMPIVLTQDQITLRWCECFTRFSDTGECPLSAHGILETTNLVNSSNTP